MNTQLAVLPNDDWGKMKEQADMLIKTGFLPTHIKTPEQVLAIALTGKELGIGMMEAVRGINVIQGKPSVSPQLMLALARRTGELERFALFAPGKPGTPPDATGAECHIKRKGQAEHVTIFGPTEAKNLGLNDRDNYKKQASVMYGWRAIAGNLRVTFPDAISGLYTPEELDPSVKLDDDGNLTNPPPAPSSPVLIPKEKPIEAEVVEVKPKSITDGERAALFKLARMTWANDAEKNLRSYIKASFETEHTSELTRDQYDQALKTLKELAASSGKGEGFGA